MNVTGSIMDFFGTQYKHAPRPQQTNMSWTLRSNVRSNSCEHRSCSSMSYRAPTYSRYARTLVLLIGTPFGSPVVPDVKSRYATAPGSAYGANAKSTRFASSPNPTK